MPHTWLASWILASLLQAGNSLVVTLEWRGVDAGPEPAGAVICRDARGGWPDDEQWQTLNRERPLVTVPRARRCRVLVRAPGGAAYFATSEFVASEAMTTTVFSSTYRTVAVRGTAADARWISGTGGTPGVECGSGAAATLCRFVPWADPGVIVAATDGERRYAVATAGSQRSTWQATRAGGVLRVQTPAGGLVQARAVVMAPALKHGSGRLRELKESPAALVTPLGSNAFFISVSPESGRVGAVTAGGPETLIELSAPGAATQRLRLSTLVTSFISAHDIALRAEDVIEGEVRSRGVLAGGATVLLTRLLDGDGVDVPEEDQPVERVSETVTDDSGRFRFSGLSRERYQIDVMHPSRGRARATVTASAFPRLELRPRAVVTGRVIRHGVPVPHAWIQTMPSIDAARGAPNPVVLATEPVRTGLDGRFEVIAPDEGLVTLNVQADGAALRVPLGQAESMGQRVDLGDLRLADVIVVDLIADLPPGCDIRAAGPLGSPGLSVVAARRLGGARWTLPVTLPGRWMIAGVCGTVEVALDPSVVDVEVSSPRARAPVTLVIRR